MPVGMAWPVVCGRGRVKRVLYEQAKSWMRDTNGTPEAHYPSPVFGGGFISTVDSKTAPVMERTA